MTTRRGAALPFARGRRRAGGSRPRRRDEARRHDPPRARAPLGARRGTRRCQHPTRAKPPPLRARRLHADRGPPDGRRLGQPWLPDVVHGARSEHFRARGARMMASPMSDVQRANEVDRAREGAREHPHRGRGVAVGGIVISSRRLSALSEEHRTIVQDAGKIAASSLRKRSERRTTRPFRGSKAK